VIHLPGGGVIKMEYVESPAAIQNGVSALFVRNMVKLPLTIRTRREGDRMSLKGMSGTKKVKDIFIDHKIPLHERDAWPVIEDQDGFILWLPGLKKSVIEGIGNTAGYYIQLTYYKY
jgi:tRNA(Ile)-lysidine synthase